MQSPEKLQQTAAFFGLNPIEYEPENAAFLTECGEKEYSAEIAAITGDQIDVVYRYSIGGHTKIDRPFPIRLISLDLDEKESP